MTDNSTAGYPRIKRVASFAQLVEARFEDGVNAFCWERVLPGDFGEVVRQLGVGAGITALDEDRLMELAKHVSDAGRMAIRGMLEDLRRLREQGLLPELNAVNGYVQREQTVPVRTDVCSFHVDSATGEADTWLCTYHGASSEGLRNEEAVRRVEVPETREALWEVWKQECGEMTAERRNGEQEERFREWLSENCYDLHYVPVEGARPFSFGVGNLWRIAVAWDGCAVPPCIHRAPDPVLGGAVRLLLIS